MPLFNGLGHIALRANDLQKSLEFYEKLGFPEFLRLCNNDGKPWIVYLRFSDECFLEIFPGGDGSPVPDGKTTGVNHLSLAVEDLDAVARHLNEVGIELKTPLTEKKGVDGNRGLWVHDPDGNRIEIMEMSPDCLQYKALAALKAGQPKHSHIKPL